MDLRPQKIFVGIKNPQRCLYNHFPNGYESLTINNMDDVDALNNVLTKQTRHCRHVDRLYLQPNYIQCFAMQNTLVLNSNGDFCNLPDDWFDAYLTLQVNGIEFEDEYARLKTRVHQIVLTTI